MTEIEIEAIRVMEALRALVDRIEEMLADGAAQEAPGARRRSSLPDRLVELKADIKAAAKRGKIEDDRYPPSEIERCYFDPALREASARFMLRTNTSPSTAAWGSGLRTVRDEISYYLYQLERQYQPS